MWVITKCINEYDQAGDYFVAAFNERPSLNEIMMTVGCNEKYANNILSNGGRIGSEHDWYYLTEVYNGQIYKHHV
jgi:hypothetical protein